MSAQFNKKSKSSLFASIVIVIMIVHIPGPVLGYALEYNIDQNMLSLTSELENEVNNKISSAATIYTNHTLIRIDSDLDFANKASAENWSGNGSETSPYIIENYYIDGDGEGFCIYIGNTTVHYIIRNCSINNASGAMVSYKWNTGIVLYNSINGTVENNSFENNDFIGVLSYFTDISQISNNSVNDSSYGIYILRSTDNYVFNNSVSNTSSNGIYLVNSGNSIIDRNNVIDNSGTGILLSSSPPPMVTGDFIDEKSNMKNEYTDDTVLLKLAPWNFLQGQSTAGYINELKNNPGVVEIEHYPHVGIYKMQLDLSITVEETIQILSQDPRIYYAEPDYLLWLDAINIPNDAKYNFLWGLNNSGQTGGTSDADIDAPEAWTISNGSSDIVVAVIDTGVDYNHPDLTGNMWKNPNETVDGSDNDGNGYIDDIYGIDAYNDDSDPMDDHSHGTHCSGTIGAVGNNSIGVVGVNWNVSIMALKFISKFNSGPTSDAIETINYMIMMKENGTNIKISSNSWGGGGFSQSLYDAIEKTRQADILFIAAAGNEYSDTDISPHYPSSYNLTHILSVAATDDDDKRPAFSNYGVHSVDVAAPGVAVYSTVLSNGYGNKSGTSMATPHTAGLAALIAATNSSLDYNNIKNLIMTTVDPIPALKEEMITGGRINAYNALTFVPSTMHLYIQNPGNNSNLVKGVPVGITASVTDGIEPIINAVVNVTFDNSDPLLRLLDNGKDADQVAGDGYYTASWTPKGPISINLTINATAPGFNPSRKQITVNIINSNRISNNTIMNNDYGIELISSTNNMIENNSITENRDSGIYFEFSTYNQIIHNSISKNNLGIEIIDESFNNQLLNNIIESNYYNGIYISPFSGGHTDIKANTIQYNDQDTMYEYPAVWVGGEKNEILENRISNNNSTAIYLFKAYQTNLRNNTITNNPIGLYLNHSMETRIFNNKITNCSILIDGSRVKHWNTHRIEITNTVNKKPVIYLKDQSNVTVPSGAGEVILANCTNITVTGHDLSGGSVGLILGFTYNSYIYNNYLSSNNRNGIYLADSSHNNITNNSFIENIGYGVFLTQNSSNNMIWLNIFANNSGAGKGTVQANDDGLNNHWNDTEGEGNYWSDYTNHYPNASNDGHVWNISYQINGSALAEDHYPLCNCTNYWSPRITDLTQKTGTTGDEHKFIVKVFDLFAITNATVYYWFGSNIINAKNKTLVYNSISKTYELSIIIPVNNLQPLNYNISASDSDQYWGSTGVRTVTISDNDAPTAGAGPDVDIYIGDSVRFNGTNSIDNIGIINTTWHFIYNDSDLYRYTNTFDFVFELAGNYTATLMVRDAAGLTGIDSIRVKVLNKTRPIIFDLTYPSSVDISERIKVDIKVIDVNDLDSVKINFVDVNGFGNNETMVPGSGDRWSYIIPAQNKVGEVTFFIYAVNIFGNISKTVNYTVNIIDNFIPEIQNISYPLKIEINELIDVSVEIYDNAELGAVRLVYMGVNNTSYNISMFEDTQGILSIRYNATIPAQGEKGTVQFHIWVVDINGNINQTPEFNINVIQKSVILTWPNIYSINPMNGAIFGLNDPIKVDVKVSDISVVAAVHLNFIDTYGMNFNETMVSIGNESYTFEIPPQNKVGNISFHISAKNSLGIWNKTKDFIIIIEPTVLPDTDTPYVRSTVPDNGSVNVKVDTKVIIIFNESMLSSSVESSITIEPEVNYNLAWGGIVPTAELTITFGYDLKYNTTYKIIIGTNARDIAENRMREPFLLIFKTMLPSDTHDKDWDFDNDGMNDTWEEKYGLDPFSDDSTEDPDNDDFSNLEEYLANTDPTNPNDHPNKRSDDGNENLIGLDDLQLVIIFIIVIIIVAIILIFMLVNRRRSRTMIRSEPSDQLAEEPERFDENKEIDEFENIYGTSSSHGHDNNYMGEHTVSSGTMLADEVDEWDDSDAIEWDVDNVDDLVDNGDYEE